MSIDTSTTNDENCLPYHKYISLSFTDGLGTQRDELNLKEIKPSVHEEATTRITLNNDQKSGILSNETDDPIHYDLECDNTDDDGSAADDDGAAIANSNNNNIGDCYYYYCSVEDDSLLSSNSLQQPRGKSLLSSPPHTPIDVVRGGVLKRRLIRIDDSLNKRHCHNSLNITSNSSGPTEGGPILSTVNNGSRTTSIKMPSLGRLSSWGENYHASSMESDSRRAQWLNQSSRRKVKDAWQRVLWRKQNYPDNFMPSERLVSVIMKGPRTTMTYLKLMMRCALISQPISIVIIFIYINKGLSETKGDIERFNSSTIFTIQILFWSFITFYGVQIEFRDRLKKWRVNKSKDALDYYGLEEDNDKRECTNLISSVRMMLFNALAVLTMYSILYFITVKTNIVRHLSQHVANDSASNMAGLMLLAHVILTDYSTTSCRDESAVEGNGLAMNIGIMCGILMASRLEDAFDSFTLLSTSVMLFSLFPMLRSHFLPMYPLGWNIVVTPLLCFVTTFTMNSTNTCSLVIDFIKVMYILLLFVVPAYYLHLQNKQLTILGPWDIPIIVPARSTAG